MNAPPSSLRSLPPEGALDSLGAARRSSHLQDLTVLVLGLGDSGLAMAAWCARHGAAVRVWDSRPQPPRAEALALAAPQAVLTTGTLDAAALTGVQLVLKSPGLAPHDERIAPLLAAARAKGIAVQGELDLFARALADLHAERAYAPQVIAITGTNGKTTTTALTALLVERCGRRVASAGNIGPTLLDTLAAALDAVKDDSTPAPLPEVWVLELSSFQLEGGGQGVQGFEPSAATVLNLTQDHLDWHGPMDAYAAAKSRVFGSRSVVVLNRDDSVVEAMQPPPTPGKGRAKPVERAVVRFGLDAPRREGDFGLVVENGMAWLVRATESDEPGSRSTHVFVPSRVIGPGLPASTHTARSPTAPPVHGPPSPRGTTAPLTTPVLAAQCWHRRSRSPSARRRGATARACGRAAGATTRSRRPRGRARAGSARS